MLDMDDIAPTSLLRRGDVVSNSRPTSSDQYKIVDFLGKGGFGECYSVENIFTRTSLAIKVVNKSRLHEKQYQKIFREIRLHRAANHPNIVRMHDAFEDYGNFFMVLELCNPRSLLSIINREHQTRGCFDEIPASRYVNQLCDAVVYLARKGILHRDIKPGNVFISLDDQVKLGDFGLAAPIEECTRGSISGTPNYLAPEIVCKEGHSLASEVWAIGCLIYCLLVGKPPFESDSVDATYQRIKRGFYSYPQYPAVSEEAKDVIQDCLESHPMHRIRIDRITDKLWLQKTQNAGYPLMRAKSTGNMAVKDINGNVTQLPPRYHRPKSAMMGCNTSFADKSRRKSITASHDSGFGSESDMFKLQSSAFTIMVEKVNQYISDLRATFYGTFTLKPSMLPPLAVAKWVDYSNRRGFGCKLTDGTLTVKFNEGACLSWPPGSELVLYSTQPFGPTKLLDLAEPLSYSEQDHIEIAQEYAEYMDRELQGLELINAAPPRRVEESVYIVYHYLDDKHVTVLLSNGLIQVTILATKVKIVLWREDDQRCMGVAVLARDLPPQAYRVVPQNTQEAVNDEDGTTPCGIPRRIYSYFEEVTSYIEKDLPRITCNRTIQVTSC